MQSDEHLTVTPSVVHRGFALLGWFVTLSFSACHEDGASLGSNAEVELDGAVDRQDDEGATDGGSACVCDAGTADVDTGDAAEDGGDLPDCGDAGCGEDAGACHAIEALACEKLPLSCVTSACNLDDPCEVQLDRACSCDDGDPCTHDLLDEAAHACLHTPVACADDGVACAAERCDAEAGCVSRPEDAACDDGSPCTIDICDASLGCRHELLAEGTACGEPSCGQTPRCEAGACELIGTRDPACDTWFTPGPNDMLPWERQGCGSGIGDGVKRGARGGHGFYLLDDARLLVAGEELLYVPGDFQSRPRNFFDGTRWTQVPRGSPVYATLARSLLPGGRLVEVSREGGTCQQIITLDLKTGARSHYAAPSDPSHCGNLGVKDPYWYHFFVGPDSRFWLFNYEGLWSSTTQGRWQKEPLPDQVRVRPRPDIVFDRDGSMWVIGGEKHRLWHGRDGTWSPVALPKFREPNFFSHAQSPRGTLFINTLDSVLEIGADGVVSYPALPEPEREIVQVASDASGRPLVRTAVFGAWPLELYRFENGAWKYLTKSESVVNSSAFRIYTSMFGQVHEIVGDAYLPVGPSTQQGSLDVPLTRAPYLFSADASGLSFDLLHLDGYSEPTGTALRVELVDDAWEQSALPLNPGVVPRCSRLEGAGVLARAADTVFVSCGTRELMAVRQGEATWLVDDGETPIRSREFAAVADPHGQAYVVYYRPDATLHFARLSSDGHLADDQPIGDAKLAANTVPNTPPVSLVWAETGPIVFWTSALMDANPEAERRRSARQLRDGAWHDLPTPPGGQVYRDPLGRVWLAALGGERPNKRLIPWLWTGAGWEAATSVPLEFVNDETMAFDAAGNPIAVTNAADGLHVYRLRAGTWEPVNDSDRPGGVNNSPCNAPYWPRLAVHDDLLCLSWLENVREPNSVLLRCTRLKD